MRSMFIDPNRLGSSFASIGHTVPHSSPRATLRIKQHHQHHREMLSLSRVHHVPASGHMCANAWRSGAAGRPGAPKAVGAWPWPTGGSDCRLGGQRSRATFLPFPVEERLSRCSDVRRSIIQALIPGGVMVLLRVLLSCQPQSLVSEIVYSA
jgi:hypothetical protein